MKSSDYDRFIGSFLFLTLFLFRISFALAFFCFVVSQNCQTAEERESQRGFSGFWTGGRPSESFPACKSLHVAFVSKHWSNLFLRVKIMKSWPCSSTHSTGKKAPGKTSLFFFVLAMFLANAVLFHSCLAGRERKSHHAIELCFDRSHLVAIPPGPQLAEVLRSSAVVLGEDGAGGLNVPQGGFDFGMDPNDDPELALVISYVSFRSNHRNKTS